MTVRVRLARPDELEVDPDLPMLNIGLFSDVVEWAAQDHWSEQQLPAWAKKFKSWGRWHQGSWGHVLQSMIGNGDLRVLEPNVCGSSFCMAGQAVAQLGYAFLTTPSDNFTWDAEEGSGALSVAYAAPKVFERLDDKGRPVYKVLRDQADSIATIAQKALGLTSEEASWFFDGDNSIGTIVDLALRFAAKRGQNLNLPDDVVALADATNRHFQYATDLVERRISLGVDTPDEIRDYTRENMGSLAVPYVTTEYESEDDPRDLAIADAMQLGMSRANATEFVDKHVTTA
jgi:hypothetical protein